MDWSKFERGVFLVNLLAVVHDPQTGKILIGKREKDPYIPSLSWGFPGGRPNYSKDLEASLKYEIKIKTGLQVNVEKLLFARLHKENDQFLSLYYHCTPSGGKLQAGELFTEVKWVDPEEAKGYFTTHMHPKIEKFILSLNA
jgi:ADP-ribose pyrophosphatase YjhB (NUDIX family)